MLNFFPGKYPFTYINCCQKLLCSLLKQHYVIFEILLSGSPYSWETVLSSTTVVKSVMVTLG